MGFHPAYYVYIVQCSDGSFYTGQTQDLDIRIKEHNGILKGGSVYTRSKRPVTLRYLEEYSTRSEALKREHELKKLTHLEKEAICKTSSLLKDI
ncbi:GIY-YIG nuclease family protein [Patescibacteria group bacterium]|nr:GIY-YIG nuclease family protein [Patescibacteria group bacterium]